MLHVILTILKILGITILILLALVLLILILVLFVPVRCRISGAYKKDKEAPYLKVDMSWLLHLVLYRLIYQGSIKENNLKISGIRVYPRDNNGKSYSQAKKDKDNKKETDTQAEINETEPDDYYGQPTSHKEEAMHDYDKNDYSGQDVIEETVDKDNLEDKSVFEKIKGIIDNILNKIQLFLKGFRDKIKNKYANVKEKIIGFVKKITDIRSFVQDTENVDAFKDVLIGIKNLLVHMRPRKLSINGELGFEDPSLTGQVFGVLAIINSYYNGCINVKANFEEPVIDIEFDVRGRVTVAYALLILLRFMKNKTIRKWVFRK